ncbi:DNA topoisomerase VI subunit B [Candidatus Woesearchaeota archaeon]|nr:DNA topoisomerase VI subunit B [Candidatus Woesearchaeota archaeon]MBT4387041.1 DNA topoisomerase VI subunit B [Candidatus Woesearchaeota archaeon]MBT4595909.1 DNA topoisomerase VI subunit B [Candidatus Woesearchaeota archaeon]MBT5741039.1 DNA topoisomerase VI subunit B [Candidatus Woesearchaeota archaeon]MBT6505280.1 DNA topoisomerase VI subunit B [Candidatus Woesearchaeota archaeon]
MTKQELTKAEELAKSHKQISIAEFFEKNKHLLGFDNKRKALMTTIKEAVDNSLDACEEARVLPEINVEIIDMGSDRFRVIVEDNGPGIVKKSIPNIFARLLYGSKFHALKQTRGQQGIGISAAALYGRLTTGKSIKIISRISSKHKAYEMELYIDTENNEPVITKESEKEWHKDNGTRLEIDLVGSYIKGAQSIDTYLKYTSIANPHCTIIYTNPSAEQFIYPRITDELPPEAMEIKPHPYGVEFGTLLKMFKSSEEKNMRDFFTNSFSRVSKNIADQILSEAGIIAKTSPSEINHAQAERLIESIPKVKIMAPPTNCIFPIGEDLIRKGMEKEIPAEFYASSSRPVSIYTGNPFIIEVGVAWGGGLKNDEPAQILRFANRVPLLYSKGACAFTQCVQSMNWKNYGLQQSSNAVPVGPIAFFICISSVWTPYTSEAKEAIAPYPEIIKEVKLSLQDVGRKLGAYIKKKKRLSEQIRKKSYIEKYLPFVSDGLQLLLDLKKDERDKVNDVLIDMLEESRPGKTKIID